MPALASAVTAALKPVLPPRLQTPSEVKTTIFLELVVAFATTNASSRPARQLVDEEPKYLGVN